MLHYFNWSSFTNIETLFETRYNTFPGFIMKIAPCPKVRKRMVEKSEALRFENMSISKKVTVIDRIRRKALW